MLFWDFPHHFVEQLPELHVCDNIKDIQIQQKRYSQPYRYLKEF